MQKFRGYFVGAASARLMGFALVTSALGCAQQVQVKDTVPFDAGKATALIARGHNQIVGSALIRLGGGGAVTCAGSQVALVPHTEYADEQITALYGNNIRGFRSAAGPQVKSPEPDPRYLSHARYTICDAKGYFKFDSVADGSFYLVTSITWNQEKFNTQGGSLMSAVTVHGGETTNVVLSP